MMTAGGKINRDPRQDQMYTVCKTERHLLSPSTLIFLAPKAREPPWEVVPAPVHLFHWCIQKSGNWPPSGSLNPGDPVWAGSGPRFQALFDFICPHYKGGAGFHKDSASPNFILALTPLFSSLQNLWVLLQWVVTWVSGCQFFVEGVRESFVSLSIWCCSDLPPEEPLCWS